jgi:hypothetical protein
LTKQLPSGFTFQAVRRFQLGEWQHHIALYQQDRQKGRVEEWRGGVGVALRVDWPFRRPVPE